MRLAALDIGSNTVHVLVADVVRGRLEDVAHYVEMPELGPQVARSGVIGSRAAIALRAVRKVIEQARTHGYDDLVATGGTASNLPVVLTRRNPPAVLATADLLVCEARLDRHRARHVAALTGLAANRVKAMRGGVEALLLLLDWYGLALLHVSHEGLRHGMLLAYLERGEDWWRDG